MPTAGNLKAAFDDLTPHCVAERTGRLESLQGSWCMKEDKQGWSEPNTGQRGCRKFVPG